VARFLTALFTCTLVASVSGQRPPVAPTQPALSPAPRLIARLRAANVRDVLQGAISPDGRSLAFVRADHSNGRLYVLDIASGKARLLTPRIGSRNDPRWSLDGKRIAFWGEVALPGHSEPVGGTWIVDVATGAEQLAFAAGQFSFTPNPTWTRDGKLVFAEPRDSLGPDGGIFVNWGLRIADSRTGATTALTRTGMNLELPAVSPDGRQVAYLGWGCTPQAWGLYLAPIANNRLGESRCLVPTVTRASVVWSADGRRIFVVAAHAAGDGYSRILMVDAATGRQDTVSLAGVGPDVREISVTDDDRLVIAARSGFARVGVVPARGGTPLVLQSDTTLDTRLPVWSLDGATIAARASGRTSPDDPDAAVPVTIVARGSASGLGAIERHSRGDQNQPARDSLGNLAWSPDGRCVADEELSYLSRDSLVNMRPAVPRALAFGQAPRSYANSAFPNEMSIYDAATQWTRDGTRVLKQAWRHLYVVARDTTKTGDCVAGAPRRVALRGFPGTPLGWRVSPDGRTIAFSRTPGRDTSAGVFVVPIDGGDVTKLHDLPNDESDGGPEWTADGKGLYFADADTAGHYRILRLTLATGIIDTITRGAVSAMHPRLSPDGRQLAVTMADVTTAIWEVRLPPAQAASLATGTAGNAPVAAAVPSDTAGGPDERLLNLVERLAARAPDLEKLWPDYWQPNRPYALYVRRGTPGTMLVGREQFMAGFREVAIKRPPAWTAHAYWRPGPPIRLGGLGLPVALIDSLPARSADSLALLRWRERTLSSLFLGDPTNPFDGLGDRWEPPVFRERAGLPHRGAGECPSGMPSSCNAVEQIERRSLSAALAAPASEATASAQEYVAVRWLHRHTSAERNWAIERANGTQAYVARRASVLVAGGDTSRLASEIVASFNRLPATISASGPRSRPDTLSFDVSFRRETLMGEALIVLLERLHYDWKADVSRGDDLLDALQRAVTFDSTRALHLAKRAYDAFGLDTTLALAEQRDASATRSASEFSTTNQSLYYTLLGMAIAGDSSPLIVTLPATRDGQPDTARFKIRYSAGEGDSASTPSGTVMLPDPESVVVESNGLRLEVHHVPVLILRPALLGLTGMEVAFFLPDSVEARIRTKQLASASTPADADERVLGPGIDLFFGGGTSVSRPNMYWKRITVTVAAPPSPPRR
jgi:Tol biopolymer transport system component